MKPFLQRIIDGDITSSGDITANDVDQMMMMMTIPLKELAAELREFPAQRDRILRAVDILEDRGAT